MNNAVEIGTYAFKPEDELLLDANVWLAIYGPQRPNSAKTRVYSEALKRMLLASCKIHLDVIIASEFVNRYARLMHSIERNRGVASDDFKQFRQSAEFKKVAEEISTVLRKIVGCCSRIESEFCTIDIEGIIATFAKGASDFNDQILTEICRLRRLVLVTHDRDFKSVGLSLLTANKELLS